MVRGMVPRRSRPVFVSATARSVAIALPVRDEEGELPACLDALDRAAGVYGGPVAIVAMANNCTDASVPLLERWRPRHAVLHWRAVSLIDGCRHAGWARRLAFDAAAALLGDDRDLLCSTDADTAVAPDWIVRIATHVDRGADAVAGRALTRRIDRAALGIEAKRRLDLLGRYYTALDRLRAAGAPEHGDPWPRHFYEGGASIALTRGLYATIGGAPTPPVAEDRALFARIREVGGRVRHPLDVRVFTSSRLDGRAPGGMADTFARWVSQPADAPLHETYRIGAALAAEGAGAADRLSFLTLPAALAEAQDAIRALGPPPQVEPVAFAAFRKVDGDRIAEQVAEPVHRLVPGERIVGIAGPVDEEEVAA